MTLTTNILIPSDSLEALCRKWRVRELSLFGSVLRDDFGPDSDVDILVSFDEDVPWSSWDLITMRDELAELFGRPVDLVEREGLRNPFRKQGIIATRRVIYRRPQPSGEGAPDDSADVGTKKPRPNHQQSLQILRSMTPQQKLAQVFKLNKRTLKLFRTGLRRRFPDLDAAAFEKVYLQMRERCHNRNY